MNARRLSLITLLAAALLLLILFVWSRAKKSPRSPGSRPAGAQPPPPLQPVIAATPTVSHPPSAELRAGLQRLLLKRGARLNEAILTFANADAYQRFLARAQHRGLTVLGQIDALLVVRVRFDSLAALEADLRENSTDYSDIAANSYVRIPRVPARADRAVGDPQPFRNATLSFLGAAGERSTWGRGTTIAILDTGVAPDATFDASRVQYLNLGLGTLPGESGEDGHGTSVAALAAGHSADAPGVAPGATILSIRVTDASGSSDIFTVAQAILAAVDARAQIINLSLGGYATNSALDRAIDYAVAHGSVIVAAAGNDQSTQLAWPAADPRVISVGAVDALGQQLAFSNSGPQLQITAPGYGVQTAWLDSQRVYVNGTSASTPLVAGAIAAVMSQNPALTAQQAWSVIRQTVSDAGAPGADPDYGNGILNLEWAMNASTPNRVDPAIASHYYDVASSQLDVVIQNRSAERVSGLTLDLDTKGSTTNYRIPELAPGGTYVLAVAVDPKSLVANGGQTFTTQLVTPFGLADANVANNRRSSRLAAPAPPSL